MRHSRYLLLLTVALPATIHAQDVPVASPAPPPPPQSAAPQSADPVPPPPAGEAPPAPAPDDEPLPEDEELIIVEGRRAPRGSVIGDIQPEIVLDAGAVRSYGASSIEELLAELAPLTGSIQGRGGGQPVVLVNGRRISGFREIRDLPPEAIARVDILPEEVALKYGFRADQRVVNFVLRRRFDAVTAEVEGRFATNGGRQQYEADVNYLTIRDGARLSLDGEYERRNPLFEPQRDLIDPDPDRTLLSAVDAFKANATYNRSILNGVSATLSGEYEGSEGLAAVGRATDGARRLNRDTSDRTGNIAYALNGNLADWQWSLNGGYTRVTNETRTDRSFGLDVARSVDALIATDAVASGTIGPVATTVRTGFNLRDFRGETDRPDSFIVTNLSRDEVNGAINADLPLLGETSAVGALSLNANGELTELSDFGLLRTVGGGFNWRPVEAVRLIGSVIFEDGAPSVQQLGNPVIVTPNVRIFDPRFGQTVEINRVTGGNPGLLADDRRVIKLQATVRAIPGVTMLANFTDTRIDNPTFSLPAVTPAIEAAFPERFVRDAGGRLLSVDASPVNFARRNTRQARWGFDFQEVLEAPAPLGPDGQPLTPEQIEQRRAERRAAFQAGGGRPGGGGGPPGGGRGFGGPGGGRGFGGPGGPGGGQGRVQASLFHTVSFVDTIDIRDGVPTLDLLDGGSLTERGGEPRHRVEFNGGYNRHGLGTRLNVNWQSATRLAAGPLSQTGDLRFDDLTTVGLRFWADLGQQRSLVTAAPFFRGARVTLAVDNLFDTRLRVEDADGVTPVNFQPDLLDALGRTVRLSFRKLF